MRESPLTSAILAVLAASAYTAAGHAQDCETLIEDVRGQLQQEQVSPQLQQEAEERLSQAQGSQDCEAIVAEVEQSIDQVRDRAEARADSRSLPTFEEADDDENGQLDAMEIATLEGLQMSADTDGDGSLSREEYNEARASAQFDYADQDSDGQLSRVEVATLDDIDFGSADSDGDGSLSSDELKETL